MCSKGKAVHQVSPRRSTEKSRATERLKRALGSDLCHLYSPDEYPFTDIADLPPPLLKPFPHPPILHPNKINVNASILSFYTQAIVPRITRQATLAFAAQKRAQGIFGDDEYEDDGNYGSAAFVDLEVLQAISKRVHYGLCPSPPSPPPPYRDAHSAGHSD